MFLVTKLLALSSHFYPGTIFFFFLVAPTKLPDQGPNPHQVITRATEVTPDPQPARPPEDFCSGTINGNRGTAKLPGS